MGFNSAFKVLTEFLELLRITEKKWIEMKNLFRNRAVSVK